MKSILIPVAVGAAAAYLGDVVYEKAQVSSGPDFTKTSWFAYLSAGLVVLAAHHFTKAA